MVNGHENAHDHSRERGYGHALHDYDSENHHGRHFVCHVQVGCGCYVRSVDVEKPLNDDDGDRVDQH